MQLAPPTSSARRCAPSARPSSRAASQVRTSCHCFAQPRLTHPLSRTGKPCGYSCAANTDCDQTVRSSRLCLSLSVSRGWRYDLHRRLDAIRARVRTARAERAVLLVAKPNHHLPLNRSLSLLAPPSFDLLACSACLLYNTSSPPVVCPPSKPTPHHHPIAIVVFLSIRVGNRSGRFATFLPLPLYRFNLSLPRYCSHLTPWPIIQTQHHRDPQRRDVVRSCDFVGSRSGLGVSLGRR